MDVRSWAVACIQVIGHEKTCVACGSCQDGQNCGGSSPVNAIPVKLYCISKAIVARLGDRHSSSRVLRFESTHVFLEIGSGIGKELSAGVLVRYIKVQVRLRAETSLNGVRSRRHRRLQQLYSIHAAIARPRPDS